MRRGKASGSITVFMSLCLSVCLLFTGALLESARALLLRDQLQQGTEAALDSLFARYDGDLFDEFGLLLINSEDIPEFQNMEELLTDELGKYLDLRLEYPLLPGNFLREQLISVQITEQMPATGMQGEVFGRCVMDYMKYRLPVQMLETVKEDLLQMEKGEEEAKEAVLTAEEEEQAKEELGQTGQKEEYENAVQDSVIGAADQVRNGGFMSLVLPPGYPVSEKHTTKSGFPSNSKSGLTDTGPGNLTKELANNLMLCEYALEEFHNFTQHGGNETLQYELEYMIGWKSSDEENLEECIRQLLVLRELMNISVIRKTPELLEQAELFAGILVGWTGIAPLTALVKSAAIAAWAYGEAIADVRSLLGGGRVPLKKRMDQWYLTSFAFLPAWFAGAMTGSGNCQEGMDYQGYLRLLLLKTPETQKYYGMMDMIQCRMAEIKPRFYMNECVYAVQIHTEAAAGSVFGQYGRGSMPGRGYILWADAAEMY